MAGAMYPYQTQDALLSMERYQEDALPTEVAEHVMPLRHGHKTVALSLFLLGLFLFLTAVDYQKVKKNSVPMQDHMEKAQKVIKEKINAAFNALNNKVGTENMAISARMTLFASAVVMLITGTLSFIFSTGQRALHKRKYPTLRRATAFGFREIMALVFIAVAVFAAHAGLDHVKGILF